MVHFFLGPTWLVVALAKCSLNMNNEEEKRRKRGRHKADHRHTKQIADDTKQYKGRQEVYAVPRGSQFCKSGLGILRKGEVIP
ncbi:hypothetical protein T4C_5313 [Trichinella pseudospiralis]|uniref:Secreted protein n=1 Tax=Trichinella pseudospiralis TaxID=6337 RepID=A0A0V1K3L2_TRIPS|nr:hypothetical protein T4C_5313 [Trichinella pseudospiralis]